MTPDQTARLADPVSRRQRFARLRDHLGRFAGLLAAMGILVLPGLFEEQQMTHTRSIMLYVMIGVSSLGLIYELFVLVKAFRVPLWVRLGDDIVARRLLGVTNYPWADVCKADSNRSKQAWASFNR